MNTDCLHNMIGKLNDFGYQTKVVGKLVGESFAHILELNVPFGLDTEECFDTNHWIERQNKQNKTEIHFQFEMDEKKNRDKSPCRFPGDLLDSFERVQKITTTSPRKMALDTQK